MHDDSFSSFERPEHLTVTMILQGIWMNLMLLYVGLSVVSITVNLCAQSLMMQMKKSGLYLKLLRLFSSEADLREQGERCVQEKDDANKRQRESGRERDVEEKFEFEEIACGSEREELSADFGDSNSATKLKKVGHVNGKYYGTLQGQ